jgi:hypothetical protein
MIISVSRRTDIPAFYSKWFYNRIQEGFCTVPNPFNYKQIATVDLKPESVAAYVFWTRFPKPLMKNLNILNELNLKYYFNYTINNYNKIYELFAPNIYSTIKCFKELSNLIGSELVIWRYDPIIINNEFNTEFHLKNFEFLCKELCGYTKNCITSFMTIYKKTERNLREIPDSIITNNFNEMNKLELLKRLSSISNNYNIKLNICCSSDDYTSIGVNPSKCIDDRILKNILKINLDYEKDKYQRQYCNCNKSKDIGINNTCVMGCRYCYATSNIIYAKQLFKKHNPESTSLF